MRIKDSIKLVAVIVTYNRLEKLKKTIASYESQTVSCSDLVIINNCSTDGTEEYLEKWKLRQTPFNKHIIKTESNLGGSGGFYKGMKYAISLSPNWIWVADDDAYPDSRVFASLYNYLMNNNCEKIACITSAVYTADGKIALEHRRRIDKGIIWKEVIIPESDYSKDFFKLTVSSYVGSMYNTKALLAKGLTLDNLFIYFDDSEHSIRISEYGDMICLPEVIVVHDDGNISQSKETNLLTWRDYYSTRNLIFMYKRHHFLSYIYYSISILYVTFKYWFRGKYNYECVKLKLRAIKDAASNCLGKHVLYTPGFTIHK